MGRNKGLFLLPSVYFTFSEFYKIIDFSYNGLYFLPTRFYDESQIEVLLLRENNLRYIDSRISNLQNLQILDLRGNEKLAEIPKSLFQIKDLKIKISRNMMRLIRKTDPLEVYETT